jgi:hypothetical protein
MNKVARMNTTSGKVKPKPYACICLSNRQAGMHLNNSIAAPIALPLLHQTALRAAPDSRSAAGRLPFSSFGKMGSELGFTSPAAAAALFAFAQPPPPQHLPSAALLQLLLLAAGAAPFASAESAFATPPPQSHGRPLLGHTILPFVAPFAAAAAGVLLFSAAVAAAMPSAAATASAV